MPLDDISASKVSLRSRSGDFFKFLISIHYPDFLFFYTPQGGTEKSTVKWHWKEWQIVRSKALKIKPQGESSLAQPSIIIILLSHKRFF